MRWQLLPEPSLQDAERLAKEIGKNGAQPLPFAKLCLQRGIDSFEKAKAFFAPKREEMHDPFLMKNMDKAVNRLIQAYQQQEKNPHLWRLRCRWDERGSLDAFVF